VLSAWSRLGPEYHSLNGAELGIINPMHIAQKFEALLEIYRRPDGSKWSGQEIDEATGGVVSRSYVTNLRKGRIENSGYEKMRAIAKAMGFPSEVWFEEGEPAVEDRSSRLAKASPALVVAVAAESDAVAVRKRAPQVREPRHGHQPLAGIDHMRRPPASYSPGSSPLSVARSSAVMTILLSFDWRTPGRRVQASSMPCGA
jgi:transcriptional regulator with XRE-family HTH domain